MTDNITLATLRKYKKQGQKFSMLTCYDAAFAHLMQQAHIDTILIGDSLGMVVQGHHQTVPVTVDDIAYHTKNVSRANQHALIFADLPFLSYAHKKDAIDNARTLMQAGAHVVKLEGDASVCKIVKMLTKNGVPVCVHLGLLPQSVNVIGGYRVAGKTDAAAKKMLDDCLALQKAGAAVLLLECVPKDLAKTITQSVDIPVIGIGAGGDTDGQVLVMHDMLGVYNKQAAKFVKNFLTDAANTTHDVLGAFNLYHQHVQNGNFPEDKHTFS